MIDIVWFPTPANGVVIKIGEASKPPRIVDPAITSTTILWQGQPVRALRSIRIVADAMMGATFFEVTLVETPSRGSNAMIPEGLVDALKAMGLSVVVVDTDHHDEIVEVAGGVEVNLITRCLCDFVDQTKLQPTHLLVSADLAEVAKEMSALDGDGGGTIMGAKLVLVPEAPPAWCYAERAGFYRPGEAFMIEVLDPAQSREVDRPIDEMQPLHLLASAPHPRAPWRFIQRSGNPLGIPVGPHAARVVGRDLVVGDQAVIALDAREWIG